MRIPPDTSRPDTQAAGRRNTLQGNVIQLNLTYYSLSAYEMRCGTQSLTAGCEPGTRSRKIAIDPKYGWGPPHFGPGQRCRVVGDLCSHVRQHTEERSALGVDLIAELFITWLSISLRNWCPRRRLRDPRARRDRSRVAATGRWDRGFVGIVAAAAAATATTAVGWPATQRSAVRPQQ